MRHTLLAGAAVLSFAGAAGAQAETIYTTDPPAVVATDPQVVVPGSNVIATTPGQVIAVPGPPFGPFTPQYIVTQPTVVVAPPTAAPREQVIERERVVVEPRRRAGAVRERVIERQRVIAPVVERERVVVAPENRVVLPSDFDHRDDRLVDLPVVFHRSQRIRALLLKSGASSGNRARLRPRLFALRTEPCGTADVGSYSMAEASMSQRDRITTALFVGVTAAVLTLVLPVEAQIPARVPAEAPSSAPAMKPADTVNLTMEQRHIIKEIILKDLKITEPADQAAKVPMEVGQAVPAGIPLQPMPVEVSAKIPQLKAHSFLVKNDKVIVIDPKDNKVAALIE